MKKITLLLFFLIHICFTNAQNLTSVVGMNTSGESYQGANIFWSSHSEATSYSIRYRPSFSSQWLTKKSITTNHLVLDNCQPNATYQFSIKAHSINDSSDWSSVTTFATTKPIWIENNVYKLAPYNFPGTSEAKLAELKSIKNNDYSSEDELKFLERFKDDNTRIIASYGTNYGSIYFENEKASYAYAQHSLVYGIAEDNNNHKNASTTFLQQADLYVSAPQTLKIDLFPSFTIKGQIPKYFYFSKFSNYLNKNYENLMRQAISKWSYDSLAFTRSYDGYVHTPTNAPIDPYRREHPDYSNSGAWEPSARNSWVDTRNTDNLKAMRETSAFLFLGEIKNTTIQDIYRTRLINHVATLYHVGYSEWDSENYFSHSFAPFSNLYAFSEDVQMRKIGKAALDWYVTTGAVKYFRGTMAGPSKRVSSESFNLPLSGVAVQVPYLYFGNAIKPTQYSIGNERDEYTSFLSGYRPTMAVYGIAVQDFDPYTEMLNTHPIYATFSPLTATNPNYFETLYYGKTYRMASAVSSGSDGDMCPYGLEIFDSQYGCLPFFTGFATSTAVTAIKNSHDQIAQFRNLQIRLSSTDVYKILLPTSTQMEIVNDIWFFKFEKTWIAFKPINMQNPVISQITDIAIGYHTMMSYLTCSKITGGANYFGYAMEICDDEQMSYEEFKTQFTNDNVNVSDLANGTVSIKSVNGHYLKMKYNTTSELPYVYRNENQVYSYTDIANFHPFYSMVPPSVILENPIVQSTDVSITADLHKPLKATVMESWKSGKLTVMSNKGYFESELTPLGVYTWNERPINENDRTKLTYLAIFNNGDKIYETSDVAKLNENSLFWKWNNARNGISKIKVLVIDAEGDSAWSKPQEINITNSDLTAPNTPIGVTANTYQQYKIQLNWTANTDLDLMGYDVYRGTSVDFVPNESNRIANLLTNNTFIDEHCAANTTYYYMIRSRDYSQNSSSNSALVSSTTDIFNNIETLHDKLQIFLYPNPCSDVLNIETNDEIVMIEIFDISNKKLNTTLGKNQKKQTLLLNHLPKGIFFIKIKTKNRYYVEKIVIL